MAQRPEDRYTNLAAVRVVESAANTITFIEMLTGISLGQGIGMLIDQIEYHVAQAGIEALNTTGDFLSFGWFTSNAPTNFRLTDRRLIHAAVLNKGGVIGTPASAQELVIQPLVYQFFPAMIIAAPRLFLAVEGTSLATPVTLDSRIYFRYIELTDKEYLELAETFILVG